MSTPEEYPGYVVLVALEEYYQRAGAHNPGLRAEESYKDFMIEILGTASASIASLLNAMSEKVREV